MGLFAGITVAGLIQGALIGAAIGAVVGGITAAIMGGDIGKGILFGAVGGAVTGGLMYGAEVALGNLGVAANSSGSWAAPATTDVAGDGALAIGATDVASSAGRDALITTTTQEGGGGFFSNLWTDLKGGFSSPSSAGTEFGAQAFGAAIKGTTDVYGGKKKIESAEKMQALAYQNDIGKMHLAHEQALEQIGAKGEYAGGSGAVAAGPDYTIEELMRRDRAAELGSRETTLAKVGAELQGQKDLNQQEFAEAGANREMMAATAGALRGANSRTGSRSTETITDVQDRIRAGENAQGAPNIGVIPPVTYVPPEQYV